jgi:hypothetical protein
MKYFEKIAFDPKLLIGPAVGAASLGTLGYVTAEKEDKVKSAIGSGVVGGIVGMAFGGLRHTSSKRKKFFESFSEKMNPLDESEKILEKSRRAMEEIDKREMAIKAHITTKGEFKYTDALKLTREKKAKFIDVLTGKKIRELGKLEKRYQKALDYHLQKSGRDVEVSESLTNIGNSMKAYKKKYTTRNKKYIEQLKTTGAWGGIGVGTAAGAGYIRKKI